MYKAIIFDFDDTLVDSMSVRIKKIVSVSKDLFGLDLQESDLKSLWGMPYEDFNNIVFKDIKEFSELKAEYEKRHLVEVEIFEGAHELVNYLKAHYTLGILTSGAKHIVFRDLEKLGFDISDFFKIVTADDSEFHKPDPRVFDGLKSLFQNQGIDASEILYIGDSVNDFKAANSAGISFIGVTSGKYRSEDFNFIGAQSVSNLQDLLDYFKSLTLSKSATIST